MFCVYLLDWFELRKRRLCYGAKKKVNKQEHGKKKSFGESEQMAVYAVCF